VTAKPDPKAPAPEADAAAQEAPAPAKAPSALAAWIPAICAILLAPAASLAVAQFVLIPRLEKKLAAAPAAPAAAAAEAPEAPAAPKAAPDAKPGATANSYEFTNVVVNLSGTMGTRYLKTSFTVTGSDAALKELFETQKPRLTDVTLNVLSVLSLAELEEPGAKNLIRDKLVASYNQALGHHVVEQVYFSDFLIQ
jgi:flagellar FliL protein